MGLIFNGNGDVIKAVDGSLTVEGLDFDGGNVNAGIVTGTSANFTGNVSVGGVLTYEDVKSCGVLGGAYKALKSRALSFPRNWWAAGSNHVASCS